MKQEVTIQSKDSTGILVLERRKKWGREESSRLSRGTSTVPIVNDRGAMPPTLGPIST